MAKRAAQVGGGEGGFEAAHARVHGDAQGQEEAQRIDVDARDCVDRENARLLRQVVGETVVIIIVIIILRC